MLILTVAFLALLVGALIGAWLADRQWIEAGMRVPSALVRDNRRFWVVHADDSEACCLLIETLHAEQDQRENARKVERLRDPPCS